MPATTNINSESRASGENVVAGTMNNSTFRYRCKNRTHRNTHARSRLIAEGVENTGAGRRGARTAGGKSIKAQGGTGANKNLHGRNKARGTGVERKGVDGESKSSYEVDVSNKDVRSR